MNAPPNTHRELPESPYLAAARGHKPSRVPVWFMRQAGRSLPEYRALRGRHRMLDACFDAELVCEITLQPVRRHKVDAAILFSDIVVPLRGAGIDLDIVPDVGPGDRPPDPHRPTTSRPSNRWIRSRWRRCSMRCRCWSTRWARCR